MSRILLRDTNCDKSNKVFNKEINEMADDKHEKILVFDILWKYKNWRLD